MRFVRDLIETYIEPCDAVVFLQTIEHVKEPEQVLAHFKAMAPVGLRLDAEPADAGAPEGADKSDNPWHLREYRAREFRALCETRLRPRRAVRPLPRPQAAGARAGAARGLGRRARRLCASPSRFYDRFTPAISARDFALREGPLDRALDFVAVLR